MSRGPGKRQVLLKKLLKRMGGGYFLEHVCDSKTEYQSYWRALKTSGLPYRQGGPGQRIWVGAGDPILSVDLEGDGRKYSVRRKQREQRREYFDLWRDYIERISGALSELGMEVPEKVATVFKLDDELKRILRL